MTCLRGPASFFDPMAYLSRKPWNELTRRWKPVATCMLLLAAASCGGDESAAARQSFDHLLTGSDVELFWGVITRIEDAAWKASKVVSLPKEQQVVERVVWFHSIFGNGGLQYWFEQDGENYGAATAVALRAIGLERSASALEQAYALFASAADWQDWDRRLAVVQASATVIQESEKVLWTEYESMEGRAGRYIRGNLHAFEDLRSRLPFDPVAKFYGK